MKFPAQPWESLIRSRRTRDPRRWVKLESIISIINSLYGRWVYSPSTSWPDPSIGKHRPKTNIFDKINQWLQDMCNVSKSIPECVSFQNWDWAQGVSGNVWRRGEGWVWLWALLLLRSWETRSESSHLPNLHVGVCQVGVMFSAAQGCHEIM